MDLLMVAREAPNLPPTQREIDDPAEAKALLPKLPHGAHIANLVARHALGGLVLSKALDRGASRAAIGVAIQRSKPAEWERSLMEPCNRAGVAWAPPSARAAPARAVVRAEEAEAQATVLIERQQWQAAVDLLRGAEPLGARGTNMLGRALLQLGDRDGARHAFERTLAGDPGNSIAQRQLANL